MQALCAPTYQIVENLYVTLQWTLPIGEGNGNPLQSGQRSLRGYSPWGRKRVRHNLVTKKHPWIQPTMDGFVL